MPYAYFHGDCWNRRPTSSFRRGLSHTGTRGVTTGVHARHSYEFDTTLVRSEPTSLCHPD